MLIKFPYNNSLIQEIKAIPGRRWNPVDKGWVIPDDYLSVAVEVIDRYYPNIADTIRDYEINLNNGTESVKETKLLPDIVSKLNLVAPLYPYQEEGVAFLENCKQFKGALIGDQPGLGKTIETLAWLAINPKARPVLVVTQASIKRNWQREIDKWLPDEKVQVLMKGIDDLDRTATIVIVNYDLIWRKNIETQLLKFFNNHILVFDEVTALKERNTKRTKTAKKLVKSAKFVIGLSGTPILNRPIEFFNFLNMINPGIFESYFRFGMRYCNGYHNGFGYVFKGSSRAEELRQLIQPQMIRRYKEDVLKDLPLKRRVTITVDLPGKFFQDYISVENNLIETIKQVAQTGDIKIKGENRIVFLSKLNYLRHLVGLGKAEQAFDTINTFVSGNQKVVVFGHHHDVLDRLAEILQKNNVEFVQADGRTSSKNRQIAIDTFQENENCLVFLTSTAMGMGINLTAASNALFIERQWTPAIEEQMEDRIHRIGQNSKVTIYYMQVANSIDDKMESLIQAKRVTIREILDGSQKRGKGDNIMDELLLQMSK